MAPSNPSFTGTLRDSFRAVRNRLIASPAFQRWAFRIPGVRAIARRRSGDLFDLVAGFVYSQVLLACVKLDVFDKMADGPLTSKALADSADLPEASADLLLKAAAAIDLVDATACGGYILGPHGAALRANPWLRGMIAHHAMLYRDLEDPVALLRNPEPPGNLAAFWPYAQGDTPASADVAEQYSTLMAQSQAAIAGEILDSYPFGDHKRVMDVGGGEGAFLEAALGRHAGLRGTLFELPQVAMRAQNRLDEAGLGDRVAIHATYR